jgi:putative tryptophan/tyrosine transport system substrate-binding protein
MTRRVLVFVLGLGVAILVGTAGAEQPKIVPVVGILFVKAGPDDPVVEALRTGLRDRGYVEGRNIRFVHRSAEGQLDRMPGLAEELVQLKVDVIVTGAYGSTRAAQQATTTIPIVANFYDQDPLASGFVDRFNRPSGNITGVYTRNELLAGKRLELLKEALPGLSRVAVLLDSQGHADLEELMPAARLLGIQLQLVELKAPYDFNAIFGIVKRQKVGAVIVLPSPELYVNSARIGALALANGLPLTGESRNLTEAGGLMSYSTDLRDVFNRIAYFVDRLLKGATVSELPVEQSERIRLVVNLKTAKTFGLTVPQSILVRADEVIK